MVEKFGGRPSEIICVEDEYTAYCFDEACLYIMTMLEQKKEPIFEEEKDVKVTNITYTCFSDLYNNIIS